jgi:hypothetical protein
MKRSRYSEEKIIEILRAIVAVRFWVMSGHIVLREHYS